MSAFPDFLVSVSPFFLILGLMAGLRWSLVRTGLAAWAWTLAAALVFGIRPLGVEVSLAKALLLALDVLPIVWGALLFFAVCETSGAIRILGEGLTAAIPWKSLRGLLLGWAFASFLQGAGGFGVPVVVAAPLLSSAGFAPLEAVVLPFIGHSWAVTFGSLGTSFQALMSASGLPAQALAGPAALLLGLICLLAGGLVGWLGSDRSEFPRLLPVLLAAGLAMAGVQYLLAVAGFWQIASLGAGAAGLGLLYAAGRISARAAARESKPPGGEFPAAAGGYLLLVGVILLAQWFGPLRTMLQSVRWDYSLPGADTARGYAAPGAAGTFLPLGNSGAVLMYASLIVYCWYRWKRWYPPGSVRRIAESAFRRAAPVTIGIVSMIGVSTLLSCSGMTFSLAAGLAAAVGAAFPALAPWLGAAGAFLTGSNTNSNLLFAPLQQDMARALGLRAEVLLAAQTGGGAVGSVLSPAKVGVGAVGLRNAPSEGEVMRRLILPLGAMLAAASAGTLLLIHFGLP